MRLLPEERRHLDLIGTTLRAEAPRLAAMFDMFTRLAGDEGGPLAERQLRKGGTSRCRAFVRRRSRRYGSAAFAFALLLAALLITLLPQLS